MAYFNIQRDMIHCLTFLYQQMFEPCVTNSFWYCLVIKVNVSLFCFGIFSAFKNCYEQLCYKQVCQLSIGHDRLEGENYESTQLSMWYLFTKQQPKRQDQQTSITFLIVISAALYNTEWLQELRTGSHKTNMLDILTISPYYFSDRKCVDAIYILILGFKGLNSPF